MITPFVEMLLLAFTEKLLPAEDAPRLSVGAAELVNIRTVPVPPVLAERLVAAISVVPIDPMPPMFPVPLARFTFVAAIVDCQLTLPEPPAVRLMELVDASPIA